jgi:hypothetical protein
MTDQQFEKMMAKLEEINQSVKLIYAKDAGKDNFNLSDLWDKIGNVEREIGNVAYSVDRVNTSIGNIDLG